MSPVVSLVSVPHVDGVWEKVSEGLAKACEQTSGVFSADYLWSECRSGQAFLAVIVDGEKIIGASVWRFEKWRRGRVFRCLALYGSDMVEWLDAHREFSERVARIGGAVGMAAGGRVGWKRLFPDAHVVEQVYFTDLKATDNAG